MNPKKMQAVMKQMGIAQEEIDADRVIIEKDGQKKVVIENPSVIKIKMQGQENFQISGDVREVGVEDGEEAESEVDNIDEDVKTIMEKVGCIEDEARQALEKAGGDLTQAIIDLS